jgi:transitional endoplasmic reticulum ATPase
VKRGEEAKVVMIAQVQETELVPEWMRELLEKFSSGIAHAFLLSGNVEDCIGLTPGTNLRSYLITKFAAYDVVVVYNRASGFFFPHISHRRRFLEAIGLIAPAQPTLEQLNLTPQPIGVGGSATRTGNSSTGAARSGSASSNRSGAGGTGTPQTTTTNRGLAAGLNALTGAGAGSGGGALQPGRFGVGGNAVATMAGNDNPDTILEQAGRSPALALQFLSRLLNYEPFPAAIGSEDLQPNHAHGHGYDGKLKVAVILEYAETLIPNFGSSSGAASEADRTAYVSFAQWGRDIEIGNRHRLVFAITGDPQGVNENLRKSGARWEQIELPFPTFEERARFARLLVADNNNTEVAEAEAEADTAPPIRLEEGLTHEEVARLTTGLRLIDLEDIVLRAGYDGTELTREHVRRRKHEIIAGEFDDVLEIVESDYGFESLGGMEELKAGLLDYVVNPMRSGAFRLVPQGIILMGPPGTGKSRIAKALAKEAGFTFVELRPSKLFDKWVGSTEQKLDKALRAIRSMAPAIAFIDEADQTVSRGEGQSGDSGVSSRFFKRLLEEMADGTQRGRVLWLAATNRPDLLDAALLRPGRFDQKIPVVAPDAEERAAILDVLTKQAFTGDRITGTQAGTPLELPGLESYRQIAELTENYTGAELELLVGKAVQLYTIARLRPDNGRLMVAEALEQALERIIPTTQDVERQTQLALAHCSDLDWVPRRYRAQAVALRRQFLQQSQTSLSGSGGVATVDNQHEFDGEQPRQGLTTNRRRRRDL